MNVGIKTPVYPVKIEGALEFDENGMGQLQLSEYASLVPTRGIECIFTESPRVNANFETNSYGKLRASVTLSGGDLDLVKGIVNSAQAQLAEKFPDIDVDWKDVLISDVIEIGYPNRKGAPSTINFVDGRILTLAQVNSVIAVEELEDLKVDMNLWTLKRENSGTIRAGFYFTLKTFSVKQM